MRQAKNEIIICGIMCCVSLAVYTIVQFSCFVAVREKIISLFNIQTSNELKDYIETIFSGLFVSAFVALVISIKNYRVQKRRTLESLYMGVDKLQRAIMDLQFLEFKEPYEMVRSVLIENKYNINVKRSNDDLKRCLKNLPKKRRVKAYDRFAEDYIFQKKDHLKEYIWEHTSEYSKNLYKGEEKEKYLEREYEEKISRYNSCIKNTIYSFAEKKNVYCDDLTMIMGDIDFVFSAKRRKEIHRDLYKRVYNQITYVRRIGILCSNHLLYQSLDDIYLMDLIIDCQKTMLDKTSKGIGYNRYAYEVECEQDKLLNIINNHKPTEKLTTDDFWVSKDCILSSYEKLSEKEENKEENDKKK